MTFQQAQREMLIQKCRLKMRRRVLNYGILWQYGRHTEYRSEAWQAALMAMMYGAGMMRINKQLKRYKLCRN